MIELAITALAAGGDGVARDDNGRVTFVPRTAVGDRVRVKLIKETSSFARAELVDVIAPSPDRVAPPCESFVAGCGGCQWQHVERAAQLAAKHAIVTSALRKLEIAIEPMLDAAPAYGWRRRARFHVEDGKVGLYALGSRRVIPLAHCPQLEPALDAALHAVIEAAPPDGELALLRARHGVVVGSERVWAGAGALVGRAGIIGVVTGAAQHTPLVFEIEPGLFGGPWDFAQAGEAGNAALIATVGTALGRGPGRLLELYAGAGNFTRGFVADGWDVLASDIVAPEHPVSAVSVGTAAAVLARVEGPFDALVLDPPRTGAAEAIDGIVRHAPRSIVYISCDPATLARDLTRLVAAGYRAERAWPLDLMPQTAHIEVVVKLQR